jgi:hypothetical protein
MTRIRMHTRWQVTLLEYHQTASTTETAPPVVAALLQVRHEAAALNTCRVDMCGRVYERMKSE